MAISSSVGAWRTRGARQNAEAAAEITADSRH
jgi:hypothetical protein